MEESNDDVWGSTKIDTRVPRRCSERPCGLVRTQSPSSTDAHRGVQCSVWTRESNGNTNNFYYNDFYFILSRSVLSSRTRAFLSAFSCPSNANDQRTLGRRLAACRGGTHLSLKFSPILTGLKIFLVTKFKKLKTLSKCQHRKMINCRSNFCFCIHVQPFLNATENLKICILVQDFALVGDFHPPHPFYSLLHPHIHFTHFLISSLGTLP